jgi:hypothetical protein
MRILHHKCNILAAKLSQIAVRAAQKIVTTKASLASNDGASR